ncbi:hypothetical protein PV325_009181 [Microctonus aethiopoides]|uniref:Uncharacterized protein n=1 Tax=Microctonus aethiopoides TaxID=144406 RepID=A0AA39KKU7_9HYME|nr:hypothetical protein PV325_009181 [Microctonus aethiopoides]KAK0099196.1 hypothetical protein PV326_000033 [Microctonus aethiopoides]KAK0165218.1 hypothetical protein PV328_003754 [Microctonus aethiopoides]
MPTIEFGKFSPCGEGNSANVKNISIDGCLCCRPKLHVLCKSCGWICRGRIRYRCPQHPNVIFINDYGMCPKCGLPDNKLAEF